MVRMTRRQKIDYFLPRVTTRRSARDVYVRERRTAPPHPSPPAERDLNRLVPCRAVSNRVTQTRDHDIDTSPPCPAGNGRDTLPGDAGSVNLPVRIRQATRKVTPKAHTSTLWDAHAGAGLPQVAR